jgi:hypothetical protein
MSSFSEAAGSSEEEEVVGGGMGQYRVRCGDGR